MKYLLDTNICIYIIKQKPIQVRQKFQGHQFGEIVISSITVAELQYGVEKSHRSNESQDALNQFLAPLEIVEFDYEAALACGRIRAALARVGTPIGAFDLLIAAHALSLNLTVVTNNEREFMRVPGLRVANWA